MTGPVEPASKKLFVIVVAVIGVLFAALMVWLSL
jgi:hypothetical protein